MGRLLEGRWTSETWRSDERGRFLRDSTSFRGRVTGDGSSGFPAEAGRYHLYVSYACPWAHRTLIARSLYGLSAAISVSVVDPFMGEDGWSFSDGPGCVRDTVNGAEHLWAFVRDVYQTPGVAETCRLDHIKQHYYRSHAHINPTRIVPRGPILDHDAPHGRDRRYA